MTVGDKSESAKTLYRLLWLFASWRSCTCLWQETFSTKPKTKFVPTTVVYSMPGASRIGCGIACMFRPECGLFVFQEDLKYCIAYAWSDIVSDTKEPNEIRMLYREKRNISDEYTVDKNKRNLTRLLILCSGFNRVVPLGNWSHYDDFSLSIKGSTRVVMYMASVDRLIVSTVAPYRMYIVDIQTKKQDILHKNDKVLGIAEDANRRELFLSVEKPRRAIKRLKFGSNPKTVLADDKLQMRGIAVDGKNQLVYLASVVKVVSCSYDGKNLTVVKELFVVYSVTFLPEEDALYYHGQRKVIRRRDGEDELIQRTRPIISEMVYAPGMIFIDLFGRKFILTVYTENGRQDITMAGRRREVVHFTLIP